MTEHVKLRDTLRGMAESTTLHGIPKIVSAKRVYVKCFWLLLVLGLCGYLSFSLSQLFIKFHSWPVQTTVSVELGTLQFPAVSFCNVNPIKLSMVKHASTAVKAILWAKETLNHSTTTEGTATPGQEDDYYTGDEFLQGFEHDLDEINKAIQKKETGWLQRQKQFEKAFYHQENDDRYAIGHDIKDMLIDCSFNGRECHFGDFRVFFSPQYGNCYVLDDKSFKSRKAGTSDGLWLTLNLETPEYITNYTSAYGIKLVIHQPGTYAFPSKEGLVISSGEETTIGLRRIDVHRISTPIKQCYTGEEFRKKFQSDFTMVGCIAYCKHQMVMEKCNCFSVDLADHLDNKSMASKVVCSPNNTKHEACRILVDEAFNKNMLECNCQSPCNESVYQKTLSGRVWPNDDYLKTDIIKPLCFSIEHNLTYLQNMCTDIENSSVSIDKYRYNFLKVGIYFEDLNYEKIVEEPMYDSYRFMSDIGGTLGLFIGASLFSFTEILELLLEICTYLCRRSKKGNEVKRISISNEFEKELNTA